MKLSQWVQVMEQTPLLVKMMLQLLDATSITGGDSYC